MGRLWRRLRAVACAGVVEGRPRLPGQGAGRGAGWPLRFEGGEVVVEVAALGGEDGGSDDVSCVGAVSRRAAHWPIPEEYPP